MGLSAAQFVPDSNADSLATNIHGSGEGMNISGSSDSGMAGSGHIGDTGSGDSSVMEISPRGKDSAVQTVPFRPMASPPVRRSPGSTSSTAANAAVSGQRGVLQAPVFGASGHPVATNTAAMNSARPETPSIQPPNMPALRAGHSGLSGSAQSSRQGHGYNYVGASGVASLPQGGSSERGSVSAAVPRASGTSSSRPARLTGMQDATNIQNGAPSELTIPNSPEANSRTIDTRAERTVGQRFGIACRTVDGFYGGTGASLQQYTVHFHDRTRATKFRSRSCSGDFGVPCDRRI
jgi:hypothetical protein